jgi:hypothetical protein
MIAFDHAVVTYGPLRCTPDFSADVDIPIADTGGGCALGAAGKPSLQEGRDGVGAGVALPYRVLRGVSPVRLALVVLLACRSVPAAAQTYLFEDFDDGSHDLALYGGAGHTIGGGVSSQSYAVEPDGDGSDFELRLDLVSLASDESSSVGSYVWPAARALVPALSDASFVVSAQFEVDEANAQGPNRSLSLGVVARCSYLYNADNCVSFDATIPSRYYRLSWAIVGEGSFTDSGAPLATGTLRLVEHEGDAQVDATVSAVSVPAGVPVTLRLEGTVVGDTLELVGRMSNGVDSVEVHEVDPTPLVGPGFGVRTGGSVKGFGSSNATGALDVDVDDLLVAPEPGDAASALVALGLVFSRRFRVSRTLRLARGKSHPTSAASAVRRARIGGAPYLPSVRHAPILSP